MVMASSFEWDNLCHELRNFPDFVRAPRICRVGLPSLLQPCLFTLLRLLPLEKSPLISTNGRIDHHGQFPTIPAGRNDTNNLKERLAAGLYENSQDPEDLAHTSFEAPPTSPQQRFNDPLFHFAPPPSPPTSVPKQVEGKQCSFLLPLRSYSNGAQGGGGTGAMKLSFHPSAIGRPDSKKKP